MRTQRITAGCWRIAIIAGLIIALPVFFGLWSLVALGHPPPRYVYVFLIVGLGAYIADAVSAGDFRRVVLGTAVMSFFVVVVNRLFWRPLYWLAERKYRLT